MLMLLDNDDADDINDADDDDADWGKVVLDI